MSLERASAIYKTECRIVRIPRYRRKDFVEGVKEYGEKSFTHLWELDSDIEDVNIHVHTLVVIPPRYAVARVVQYIMSQSAKALNLFPL